MRRLYTLHCSTCKRIFIEVCKCKLQKAKKSKEKLNKTVELNLDKHCGVFSPTTNSYCLRSLKCKSHSVHLKRAVKGRSKPYDILLAELKMNLNLENTTKEVEVDFLIPDKCHDEILDSSQRFLYPLSDTVLKQSLTCRRPINM